MKLKVGDDFSKKLYKATSSGYDFSRDDFLEISSTSSLGTISSGDDFSRGRFLSIDATEEKLFENILKKVLVNSIFAFSHNNFTSNCTI